VVKLVSSLKTKVDKLNDEVTGILEKVNSNEKTLDEICDGKLTDNLNKVIDGKISLAVAKLDTAFSSLSEEFKKLKEQSSETEMKLETAIEAKLVAITVDTLKKDLEPTWASIVGKEVNIKFEQVSEGVTNVKTILDDTRKKADEERDRENRSHNIIIYRVPEIGVREERIKSDKTFCLELFNDALEMEVNENEFKFFRLGKGDQNRPLMVQCREKTLKNRIMECLNKLKTADDKFKDISITHDLTKNERAECKELVEEAKKKQSEEKGEYLWRVRGLPGQLKVVRLRKN